MTESRKSGAPQVVALYDRQLDAVEHWALAAFFADLGISDVYWWSVREALEAGPYLLVVAVDGDWPPEPRRDAIHGVMQAIPSDRESVLVSPAYLRRAAAADIPLIGALYKRTLETATKLGMSQVRYEVDLGNAAVRRVLEREGFREGHADDARLVGLEADARELLGNLGLDRPIADLFNGDPVDRLTCFQSVLQLGGLRRPPGVAGNPVGSEPGTPDPPDGGTPPSPTPDGGTPTVGSEPGTP